MYSTVFAMNKYNPKKEKKPKPPKNDVDQNLRSKEAESNEPRENTGQPETGRNLDG